MFLTCCHTKCKEMNNLLSESCISHTADYCTVFKLPLFFQREFSGKILFREFLCSSANTVWLKPGSAASQLFT